MEKDELWQEAAFEMMMLAVEMGMMGSVMDHPQYAMAKDGWKQKQREVRDFAKRQREEIRDFAEAFD